MKRDDASVDLAPRLDARTADTAATPWTQHTFSALATPVSISVVVPTHRRPGALGWALASILKQNLDGLNLQRAKLVVINNDTQRAAVEDVVARVRNKLGDGRWDVRLIHRDPPLPPLQNMYEGIREFTETGDIVFLNGDDDLVLQNSFALRARMVVETNADVLVTAAHTGLWFSEGQREDQTTAIFTSGLPGRAHYQAPRPLPTADLHKVSAIFMSNNTYRNGPLLWDAHRRTLDLMFQVPGEGFDRASMLPQFLVLPFIEAGRAFTSTMRACIRGNRAAELFEARAGRQAWIRPGYHYATCLYLLTRTELAQRPGLAPLRGIYRNLCLRWHARSRRIPEYRALAQVLDLPGPIRSAADAWQRFCGWCDHVRGLSGIHALRLRWRVRHEPGRTWDDMFTASNAGNAMAFAR